MDKIEWWDLYDKNRNKLNKLARREIDPLLDHEYHLCVHAWIINHKGEILLTQRACHKNFAFQWECIRGSVVAGEDSKHGLIREIKEEIGVDVSKQTPILLDTIVTDSRHTISDVWLYRMDIELDDISFTDQESIDAKIVTFDQLKEMFNKNEMLQTLEYMIKMYPDTIQ